jgi:hypothetical protein
MCFLSPLLGYARINHQSNSGTQERLEATNAVQLRRHKQGYQQNWINDLQKWAQNAFHNRPRGTGMTKRVMERLRPSWDSQQQALMALLNVHDAAVDYYRHHNSCFKNAKLRTVITCSYSLPPPN